MEVRLFAINPSIPQLMCCIWPPTTHLSLRAIADIIAQTAALPAGMALQARATQTAGTPASMSHWMPV